MEFLTFSSILDFISAQPIPSPAYIGPGIGAGTVAIVLGLITSILLGMFAIIWYPIKALIKKIKSTKSHAVPTEKPSSNSQTKEN